MYKSQKCTKNLINTTQTQRMQYKTQWSLGEHQNHKSNSKYQTLYQVLNISS